MSQFCALLLTACLVVLTVGNPIKDGEDVGLVDGVGKRITITGQMRYPFMVYIKIDVNKVIKTDTYICGGVILGRRTVLTAAHCIYKRKKATIHVHAGIVHKELEAKKGQKIEVVNMLVHEDFHVPCEKKGSGKCCSAVNDLGILWLERPFVYGPTVQKAQLGLNEKKPLYKEGWILGWGLNSLGQSPTMLQRGRVKVVPQNECDKFNPNFKINNKMICVNPVNRNTRAQSGDCGGPLVLNKFVYGLSSTTFFEDYCDKTMDLYTYIPPYNKWIQRTLQNGPPVEEVCTIC